MADGTWDDPEKIDSDNLEVVSEHVTRVGANGETQEFTEHYHRVKKLLDQGLPPEHPEVVSAIQDAGDEELRTRLEAKTQHDYAIRVEKENVRRAQAKAAGASAARLEQHGMNLPESLTENVPHSERLVKFTVKDIPDTPSNAQVRKLMRTRGEGVVHNPRIRQLQHEVASLNENRKQLEREHRALKTGLKSRGAPNNPIKPLAHQRNIEGSTEKHNMLRNQAISEEIAKLPQGQVEHEVEREFQAHLKRNSGKVVRVKGKERPSEAVEPIDLSPEDIQAIRSQLASKARQKLILNPKHKASIQRRLEVLQDNERKQGHEDPEVERYLQQRRRMQDLQKQIKSRHAQINTRRAELKTLRIPEKAGLTDKQTERFTELSNKAQLTPKSRLDAAQAAENELAKKGNRKARTLSFKNFKEGKSLSEEDREQHLRVLLEPNEMHEYLKLQRRMQQERDTATFATFPREEARANVLEYNKLRKENQKSIAETGEGLKGDKAARHQYLRDKLLGYDIIKDTDEEGRLPSQKEALRVKKALEGPGWNPGLHGLRPEKKEGEDEDPEYAIGQYGQENVKLGGVRGAIAARKRGESAVSGATEGWRSTHKFQTEQLRRKYNALKTGEATIGWGPGGEFGVPPEKAKTTVGPSHDILVRTNEWQPAVDQRRVNELARVQRNLQQRGLDTRGVDRQIAAERNKPTTGQDKFVVHLERSAQEKQADEIGPEGEYTEEGRDLSDTLAEMGIKGTFHARLANDQREPHLDNKGGYKQLDKEGKIYVLTTDQGVHLNPEQIQQLQEKLNANYGLKNFKSSGTINWTRKKRRVAVGYQKLPKDVKRQDIVRADYRNIYTGKLGGTRFGERNQYTGELLPGERDSVGLKLGNKRVLQRHFDDSTDAIGWGTSWRPGEKEVSNIALAVPRNRQKLQMAEAWEASLQGNDKPLNDYVNKYYPNDETEPEREEHRSIVRKQGKDLVGAGFLASYYGYKKTVPARVVNATWDKWQHIPKLGPASYKLAERHGFTHGREEGGGLMKDTGWTYRRMAANWMDRGAFRVQHPFKAGTINPLTGDLEVDPTVPGIMNSSMVGTTTAKTEFNPPNIIRYRKHFYMPPGEREGRQLEKRVGRLRSLYDTRIGVEKALTDSNEGSAVARRYKLWQARLLSTDPRHKSSEVLVDELRKVKGEIDSRLDPKTIFELDGKKGNTTIDKELEYKKYLVAAQGKVKTMLEDIDKSPDVFTHEHLGSVIRSYASSHESQIPKAIKAGGKATVIGAGLAAGGVLAVDRYQVYKQNKGKEINHPFVNAVVPERIWTPKVSVKRTEQYTLPDNKLTNFLDFQGEKVPTAGKISMEKKERIRLREHKDITGEGYKKNLPLLGGLGVTAPTTTKGSWSQAVTHEIPSAASQFGGKVGPSKNMYVLGRKMPIDFSIGRKERWQDSQHKLRAKYNPYKLDQEDREHLVALGDDYTNFYGGDEKIKEMKEDATERDRILRKHAGWARGSVSEQKIKREREKRMRGQGQTLEDWRESTSRDQRAKRDQQRPNRVIS